MDTPPPSKFSYFPKSAPCELCARPETYGIRIAFGMATFAAGVAGGTTGFVIGSWNYDVLTGLWLCAFGDVASAVSVYAMGRVITHMIDSGFDFLDQSANATWEGTK